MRFITSRGDDDEKQELVRRARALLDAKELTAGKRETPRPPALPCPSLPAASVVTKACPVVHLPRWCGVFDELWLAIYGRNGSGYGFTGSFALTRQYQTRYAPENLVALPGDFEFDSEQCGCCGKWTPQQKVGAIWCPWCRAFVCYGNTSLNGYFVCRPRCGFEGPYIAQRRPEMGFLMGRAGQDFGTQF